MSDYAIVNLKELEDSAAGQAAGIEARFARKHLASEHGGVTYMRYEAGVRSPMAHSYREQEEVYIVTRGAGKARLDDEVRDIRQWDAIRVSPATIRAFEAAPTASSSSPSAPSGPTAATESRHQPPGSNKPTRPTRRGDSAARCLPKPDVVDPLRQSRFPSGSTARRSAQRTAAFA